MNFDLSIAKFSARQPILSRKFDLSKPKFITLKLSKFISFAFLTGKMCRHYGCGSGEYTKNKGANVVQSFVFVLICSAKM